jgi:hypothetical protein
LRGQGSGAGFLGECEGGERIVDGNGGPESTGLFLEGNKKPAEAGFFQDHADILSAAFQAMVDHP